MTGAQFGDLHGEAVSSLGLYRYRQGRIEPIIFQIDERVFDAKEGRVAYALTHDPGGALTSQGNGRLDAVDELAFMSADAGEKARVPVAGARTCYEIAITDPAAHTMAYVYLAQREGAALALGSQKTAYVAYDVARDAVSTERYQTAFLPKTPLVQAELVLANREEGVAQNVLDRFKMRFFLDLRHFFNMTFKEDSITSRLLGYTAGPIRVIRRLVIYQKIGPIRVTPKALSDYIFYFDRLVIPSTILAPFDAEKHLKAGSFAFGGFDFSQNFVGSQFYSQRNPVPVVIDGRMSPAEQALTREDINWWAVTGEKGHVVVRVDLDPVLVKAGVTIGLHYDDDNHVAAPPESEPGQSIIGFDMDPRHLPKGTFRLKMYQFFPPKDFKSGDESRYLDAAAALRLVSRKI